MNTAEFRKALKAEPFVPFRIRMASGRVLAVPHPDFAMCPPEIRVATVFDAVDGAHERVDLLLVESIEFVEKKRNGKKKSNGKKKG